MKKATIKDVAREAGVSIATVSNAFRNPDVLSPVTRVQVLEVAKRLQYIPNQNGQNLRSKETKAIGLFVTSMKGAFYGVLADTMHLECEKMGYELYIYIVNKQETIINNLIGRRVDGAVILYDNMPDELLHTLCNAGSPVVFLDQELAQENVSSVIFDSIHEGELATKYLLSLGHKSIMHICGRNTNFDSVRRHKGFLKALAEAGIAFDESMLLNGLFERDAAYREMKRYIQAGNKLPDAVFAGNDLSAIGAIEAIKDEGLRVPEDVSVIGCDDIGVCELLSPAITTIHTSFESQGAIAIKQLMAMLLDKKEGAIVQIDGRLVIRQSCGAK